MSVFELRFADGQLAALERYKLGWPAPTHPVVQNSAVLRSTSTPPLSTQATQNLSPPTDPQSVAQIFSAHEQGQSQSEPRRKLSADNICTSCRKVKHYGPCAQPRPIPALKTADFNLGMLGGDPSTGDNPSTSPHYHSATSATALARAQDGRPADEQAATGFADLFRHQGITNNADEPGRMTGGLTKVSRKHKLADFMRRTEKRGPTVNPYAERATGSVPVKGMDDTGTGRMWRSFDNAVDSTSIDGGAGTPSGEPAA